MRRHLALSTILLLFFGVALCSLLSQPEVHNILPSLSLSCSLSLSFTGPPQGTEKLTRGPADSTPLPSHYRLLKGHAADSSRIHLGVPETSALGMPEPFPQKLLLAQRPKGGGPDLCSAVSPCVLRLSGAGFAYYAPGPETSV